MASPYKRRKTTVTDNSCKPCTPTPTPCVPAAVEEPELSILYCAGDTVPLQSVGLVVVVLKDGTERPLGHGTIVPVDIDGFVIMDTVTRQLKYVPGPTDMDDIRILIHEIVNAGAFATINQLNQAIASIVHPPGLSEQDVRDEINEILVAKNYLNSVQVCQLLDTKVPAAIANANIQVDPIQVINHIQSYLAGQSYVNLPQVKACITDSLATFVAQPDRDAIKAIALDCFKTLMDDLVKDGFSYVESGTLMCTPNGTLNIALKQSQAADVTLTGDLSKFLDNKDTKVKSGTLDCLGNGVVRVVLCMNGDEPDVVITGNLNGCFEDEDNYVTAGSMVCSASGVVTTTLKRTGTLPDLVFSVDIGKLGGGTTDPVSQCVTGLSSTVTGNVVTQVLSQANCAPITSSFTLPATTQTSECLTSFTSSVQNRRVSLNLTQDNCGTVTTQFDIPEGGGTGGGEVTGLTLTCNAQRQVTFGLNQTVGSAQTVTANFANCFPDTNTLTETAAGVALPISASTGRQILPAGDCVTSVAHAINGSELTTTIAQANCPNQTATVTLPTAPPACISQNNLTISNNVLTSTISQTGCPDRTGSVTLPAGAVSSTVTSGTHVCNTAGTLTTTINQSGAAPVSFSADLSKFLDNTDTNTTVTSGSMSCNGAGVVTTTINQSSGPAVTFNADLTGCFPASTDTKLATTSFAVTGAGTVNAALVIENTLSDGSVVPVTIPGSQLVDVIKAFITCESTTDAAATCKSYESLKIDGTEICRLEKYTTPINECVKYCVSNIEGTSSSYTGSGSITATTDNGSQYSITWPNGTSQTVNSGSTATFNFTGDLGEITICHDDPCANVTELIISPVGLKDVLTSKNCGC